MDTFTNAFDEKIRPLMDKIDQARSLVSLNEDGIKFPNVVVVGDQSSGKSTLLEALSLVELPKGTGIVTRCPLVLRLRRSENRRVFRVHQDKSQVLLDEKELDILQYIENETKKLAGEQKNVVRHMIELLVEDPHVRDLTVIDLPGIARNAIGDQPKDIHKQTTDLIRYFIEQEGSVILCVFPANVDVATVESFAIAKDVDPEGVRTIGVITKTDLASNYEELAKQLLMERSDVLQLKLGFIAVRNRSTNEKISLVEARQREKEFFANHSLAKVVGSHCLGIDALINRLADLYSDRVKDIFPKMCDTIEKKLRDVRKQLAKLPPALETPSARLAKYYELSEVYVKEILAVSFQMSADRQYSSIVNALHGKFTKLEQIIHRQNSEIFSEKYRANVKTAMSACFGEQLPNFLPHPVLKRLILTRLDQLWKLIDILIRECFQLVISRLLDNAVDKDSDDLLLRKLLPYFRQLVYSYIITKQDTVITQLQEMLRLEKNDPYTLNNYYMETIQRYKDYQNERNANKRDAKSTTSSVHSLPDTDDNSMLEATANDDLAVQEMIFSMYSYWKLLIKRFIDYTALSIRGACAFDMLPGILERLRQMPVEQPDFVDVHLSEDATVQTQRRNLLNTQQRLEKVNAILGGGGIMSSHGNNLDDTLTTMRSELFMSLDKFDQNLDDMSGSGSRATASRKSSEDSAAATSWIGSFAGITGSRKQ